MGSRRAQLALGAACAAAILGAWAARVVVTGDRELAASTAALEVGDPREAIVRARRAATLYAPGAPHVPVAFDRLRAMAEGAEAAGRDQLSLLAWRSIRLASMHTRVVAGWEVNASARDQADREIARLMANRPDHREPDPAARRREYARLQLDTDAAGPWRPVLAGGGLLMVVGLRWGASAAAGPSGTVDWRRARGALALILLAGAAIAVGALYA